MSASSTGAGPAPGAPRYRDFTFGVTQAVRHERNGAIYLRCEQDLQPYPQRMADRLVHWAAATPDQVLYAQRDPVLGGDWRYMQRLWLSSPGARMGGGTDEILRNVIAERVLGLPGEIRTDRKIPFRELERS